MTPTEKLRAFILTELHWEGPPEELTDDYPLVSRRAIDSLDTLKLAGFIEREFGVEVLDTEMVGEHFGTVAALARLVEAKTGAGTGGSGLRE